jgi:hypothetical protein
MVLMNVKTLSYCAKNESKAKNSSKNCVGKTTVFSAIDVNVIRYIL